MAITIKEGDYLKVVFIYPDILHFLPDYQGAYYVGIGLLSAILKREQHQTSLIHLTNILIEREKFLARVKAESPELLAFSATTHTFSLVAKLASWLKEEMPDIPTICGGVHATLCPEETLKSKGIDMICVGDGEIALTELCHRLATGQEYADIPGIWFKQDGKIVANGPGLRVDNLDSLPFPDRTIFDYPRLFHEREGSAVVVTSRGCPYSCSYCSSEALRGIYRNKNSIRYRSVENVITEIKEIVQTYPFIKAIHFDDDNLFLRRDWAEEFATRYPDEVGLPFCCNLHPNLVTKVTVALLRQAGCTEVRIGLESGNDYIRNHVLNRGVSRQQIVEAVARCQAAGIRVRTFNMIGVVYENAAAVVDTIRLNAEVSTDLLQHSIFQPYPGTKLYQVCLEKGFIRKHPEYDFYTDTVLNQPSMSRAQVLMFQKWFPYFVQLYRFLYRLPHLVKRPVDFIVQTILSCPYSPPFVNLVMAVSRRLYKVAKWPGRLGMFGKVKVRRSK